MVAPLILTERNFISNIATDIIMYMATCHESSTNGVQRGVYKRYAMNTRFWKLIEYILSKSWKNLGTLTMKIETLIMF